MDVSEEKCLIHGDAGNISQVLLNLAVNARDAMPEGGRMTISAGTYLLTQDDTTLLEQVHPGEYVKLVVEDTGTGIAKDIIERIFEPF